MANTLSSKHKRIRKFDQGGSRDPKRSNSAKRRSQYLRQARANKRSQFV